MATTLAPSSKTAPPPPHRAQPLCTTCAYPAPHVYTTYTSAANIRLAVCRRCQAFIDPLIEAPPLLLVLDLVLLKPRLFIHLLFNRGSPPASSAPGATNESESDPELELLKLEYDRRQRVNTHLITLAAAVSAAEVAVRIVPSFRALAAAGVPALACFVLLTTGRVAVELAAQLGASLVFALAILWVRGWYPVTTPTDEKSSVAEDMATRDGRKESFLPSLVPLTLLYTALLPLLLQLVLGIWYAPDTTFTSPSLSTSSDAALVPAFITDSLPATAAEALSETVSVLAAQVWTEGTDRVWAGTRLLGGMSAGFGLRVLLPTRPWETTSIVLAGWAAALYAGRAFDAIVGN